MKDTNNNYQKIRISRVEYHHNNYVKKSRLRLWAFFLLCIFFLTLIGGMSVILLKWHTDNKKIKKLNLNLEDIVKSKYIDEEGTLQNPPSDKESDYWYYIKVPFYNVDFNELLKKNKDTVGFIHMNSSNINYPIVQADDNEYYLNHAFDKSKNDAGWVFMDAKNNKQFTDFNTIIYGHGRLNKTVFGSLKNVLKESWQKDKDNYTISISTPSKNYVYQIFSVYNIKKESYYIKSTFTNEEDKEEWVKTMVKRNIAPIETTVDSNDHIITLSTCENNSGGRIVVHAKLIKEQKRS